MLVAGEQRLVRRGYVVAGVLAGEDEAIQASLR
jgi:hypothetical protein